MGNAQCLVPEPSLQVLDDDSSKEYPFSDSYQFEVSDLVGRFLQFHLQERSSRCLIDPRLVVEALAHQTEELIRREREEKLANFDAAQTDSSLDEEQTNSSFDLPQRSSAASIAVCSEASGVYATTEISGILSSISPSVTTAITTYSARTRVAGNRHSRRKLTSKILTSRSSEVLGQNMYLDDRLYLKLVRLIEALVMEEEKRRKEAQSFLVKSGCSILPVSASNGSKNSAINLVSQTKMRLLVLHLRFTPRCAEYFQAHVVRQAQENQLAKSICDGIASSSTLIPPRGAAPGLARNDSDSLSSNSMDHIDFGVGPHSLPITLLVNDSPFVDLGITGSLGLAAQNQPKPSQRSPAGGGGSKCICPPEHYKVLFHRRSGSPLAVCALKVGANNPVVRIYATKFRVSGQQPSSTTWKLGLDWCTNPFPLYAWAEIVAKGNYPDHVKYSIYMATGHGGRFEEKPSYIAEHSSVGFPEIRIQGKTESETEYTGCAVLCLSRDGEDDCDDGLHFRLSVSKGIDPALMVCFAAFVDESMEHMMSIHCPEMMHL